MKEARKLHIGGECRVSGWENLNIAAGATVDHVQNALDLSNFEDNTFSEIYASHVLNHLGFEKVKQALIDWCRVIIPGGKIFVSVPNINKLLKMVLDTKDLQYKERRHIFQMIYGGQSNEFDYNTIGFNVKHISYYLSNSGFVKLCRVEKFGLFDDSSNLEISGQSISLNITGQKPL